VGDLRERDVTPFPTSGAGSLDHRRQTKEEDAMTIIGSSGPDLVQVKERQQHMWASGDYHAVAMLIQPIADTLCDAADLQAGWRVLDVACGSGNATIAAARCGCEVVGVDYVAPLLARGRRRAEAEGVSVEFRHGDAEAIPYPDGSFDAVLSVFGSMFAPDHDRTAAELARVCRPGGRIGLATWKPDGFIGEMLKTVTAYAPPPPGVASPLSWGTESYLRELFGDSLRSLDCSVRSFRFRFRSAEAFVDYFQTFYGPTVKAFAALEGEEADALRADLVELVRRFAGTGTGTVAIPAAWLETVAIRASGPAGRE
jgi:ubiquinone/menaquinone biosynthesis C-methylase UbiE